jgi:Holliday junction resolvasome RuvABC DNA-binding subunit
LYSPGRIIRGGIEALTKVPGVGEKKAEKILAAAQEWMAQRLAVHSAQEPEPAALPEAPAEPAEEGMEPA